MHWWLEAQADDDSEGSYGVDVGGEYGITNWFLKYGDGPSWI